MGKLLYFLILFLMIQGSFAITEQSKLIKYVQSKYANQFSKYPILIFDQDEISWRYLNQNAFGDSREKEKLRVAIIQEYVKEKIGVELSFNDALSYESYTTKLKEGAFFLPILDRKRKDTFLMCGIFPASDNLSLQLETHRILGMDYDYKGDNPYEGINFHGLKEKLTLEELKLYSIYHELGHCLDTEFMPEIYTTWRVEAQQVHLSESFAEVMALFFLEREGVSGTALKRALYRNLYTQKVGPWLAQNPQFGFGNHLFKDGGIIYDLSPVLIGAREELLNIKEFSALNLSETVSLAKRVVQKSAHSSSLLNGIRMLFEKGEVATLNFYGEYKAAYPDLFSKVYEELSSYIKKSRALLKLISGHNKDEQYFEEASYVSKEICSLVRNSSKDEIFNYIQTERTLLANFKGRYKYQKTWSKDLASFYRKLSECKN